MNIDFGQTITLETAKKERDDQIRVLISGRRYEKEIKGITFNGTKFSTDRQSQSMLTGAAVSAMLDPSYSVKWKTSAGFVQLSSSEVIAAAQAVRAHVQACFDREAELTTALEDGTYLSSMLDEGWPE
ncbi:hypothetical protein PMW_148 [Pseudomonas phage phiPMW]|uniref:DUF4376 domain-containing protein n=1 Tax=Pseudomonas phage phiPMW TaxID=1815582 RepID=A0A1S5R1J2_9CAUD|nr:tail fiber protein [Pseudomonas phage phiPMW]ANA49273.1 hypothetical protein PMW_148 [Pseudomonas phage phiPMW]